MWLCQLNIPSNEVGGNRFLRSTEISSVGFSWGFLLRREKSKPKGGVFEEERRGEGRRRAENSRTSGSAYSSSAPASSRALANAFPNDAGNSRRNSRWSRGIFWLSDETTWPLRTVTFLIFGARWHFSRHSSGFDVSAIVLWLNLNALRRNLYILWIKYLID